MPEKPTGKLGELLVEAGIIDELQLQSALGHQKKWGGRLGKVLVDLGFVEESELLKFLSEKFKIQAVDLTRSKIPEQAFSALPEKVARKYGVVPVFLKEGPGNKKTLILAMSDPSNLKVIDEIQFLTGYRIEPVLATDSAIEKVLENYGHYQPEEPAYRKDIARPVDLKKEQRAQKEQEEEIETLSDDAIILDTDEVENFLDLEEVNKEGIDIIPDQNLEVVKDEVVMVKAKEPKPWVGSSTERIPSRAPIRDQVEKIPEVEPFSPPVSPPSQKPEKEPGLEEALKVPEINIFSEAEKKESPAQAQEQIETSPQPEETPIAEPELETKPEPIEISEKETEEKLEVAPPHEFVGWQPQEEAIDIEEKPGEKQEEKLEVAPAHEFLGWEPQEKPLEEETKTEPEPSPLSPEEEKESEFISFAPEDQEKTQLAQPEAEEDFWKETEPISKIEEIKIETEDRLPFEKPIEEPEPSSAPAPFLGVIEEITRESASEQEDFYTEPESLSPDKVFSEPEPMAPEEMSLEFALQKIEKLESQLKEKEFQIDELINLMMKKELGEITTEIFMRELDLLKSQLKKKNKK